MKRSKKPTADQIEFEKINNIQKGETYLFVKSVKTKDNKEGLKISGYFGGDLLQLLLGYIAHEHEEDFLEFLLNETIDEIASLAFLKRGKDLNTTNEEKTPRYSNPNKEKLN